MPWRPTECPWPRDAMALAYKPRLDSVLATMVTWLLVVRNTCTNRSLGLSRVRPNGLLPPLSSLRFSRLRRPHSGSVTRGASLYASRSCLCPVFSLRWEMAAHSDEPPWSPSAIRGLGFPPLLASSRPYGRTPGPCSRTGAARAACLRTRRGGSPPRTDATGAPPAWPPAFPAAVAAPGQPLHLRSASTRRDGSPTTIKSTHGSRSMISCRVEPRHGRRRSRAAPASTWVTRWART